MAVTVKNIFVGAAELYKAAPGTLLPASASDAAPFGTAAAGLKTEFDNDANWDSLGGTQEGVEVAYAPDYGEVEIDQLKDAAILFNQGVNITVSTNVAEATLQNLLLAWGVGDGAYVQTAGEGGVFSIDVPSEEPVERKLAVVGRAPDDADGVAGSGDYERCYEARRVISMEGSTHSLRRTEATVFPITFRLLPDPSYAGSQYGRIIDRKVP